MLLILITACKQEGKKKLHQVVEGNWFVLYPDDNLLTAKQDEIYAEIQDSITDLKCLKLISFKEGGVFTQLDSVANRGKWGTKDNEYVIISDGGNGFESFKALFSSYSEDDSVLKITETVKTKGENLRFVWNLKRLESGERAKLFDDKMNNWRNKPAAPETDEQLRKRLSEMLLFYSAYFKLISEESSYFMPMRVFLPMKYYQHAIGMKDFKADSKFVSFFYSEEQAEMAYRLLTATIKGSDFDEVKGGKSYTREYSQMLKIMAKTLVP
ncbi:MAG: hypothetical protein IPH18_02415 [Chitinophagaceae bacterium]|nr:hypothetical protein [Chitinophagaceae bacterium]MBK8951731.1 hypothetical protein [Chitinophagaceae bacterium]